MRVTQKMRHTSILLNINRSFDRMSAIDMQRRITKPSDDPAGTEQMIRIRSMLSRNNQFQANVASASRWLTYSEGALATATDNMRSIKELALTAADDANSLEGMVETLDGIIETQLQAANTEQGGRYLFSGSAGHVLPFVRSGDQVLYHGDDAELSTAISSSLSLRYNLPGSRVFGEQEASYEGTTDWDPAASWTTASDDLFDGNGLDLGKVKLVDGGGDYAVVDLRGAANLGEIRDRIESALPNLSISLVDGERLQISDTVNPGGTITVSDVQGGITAATLGLDGTGAGGTLLSRDLDPMLNDSTPLDELRGLTPPLGSVGVQIGGGPELIEVDLSTALTVGDLRGALEAAAPELTVRTAASGNRLLFESEGLVSIAIVDLEDDSTAGVTGMAGEAVPLRPFGALLDLREALVEGDREAARALMPELEKLGEHFISMRAAVGSRLNLAEDAQLTLENRNFTLTQTLSEIGDADMTEAILQYQSAESIYQASLLMASNIYQMTLANYL